MKHSILSGNLFIMHKHAGKLRPTCKLVRSKRDIPGFLLDAGAVTADDNHITMTAVEGSATRKYPQFLSWEKTDKLPCGYGAWPKDNGEFTLVVDKNGACFEKAPNITAALLVCGKPLPEPFMSMENVEITDGECRVRTAWGEVRSVPIPTIQKEYTGVIVRYGERDINLLTLSELSAAEYIVVDDKGNDIGKLLDIITR